MALGGHFRSLSPDPFSSSAPSTATWRPNVSMEPSPSPMRHSVINLQDLQQRLLRDQSVATAAFIDSLKALGEELAAVKAGYHDSATCLDTQVKELKDRFQGFEASLRTQGGILEVASSKLEKMHNRVSACENSRLLGDMQKAMDNERAAHESKHSSLKTQLDHLEGKLKESLEKHESHSRSLEGHNQAHGQLAAELKVHAAQQDHLSQRIGNAESLVGDSTRRHGQEVMKVQKQLEQLQSHLAAEQSDRKALSSTLEEVRQAHSHILTHKDSSDARQAALQARHASLEQRLQDAEQRIRDAVGDGAKHLVASSNDLHDIHGRLHAERGEREAAHAAMDQRLRAMEASLSNSANDSTYQWQAMHKNLQDLHGQVASELNARVAHHTSVEDRLHHLEAYLTNSMTAHRPQLEATQSKLQELDQKVQVLQQASHSADTHAVDERLEMLERSFASHSRDLLGTTNQLDELHNQLACSARSQEERFKKLEDTASQASTRLPDDGLEDRLRTLEVHVANVAHAQEQSQLAQAALPPATSSTEASDMPPWMGMSNGDRSFFRSVTAVIMQDESPAVLPLAGSQSPKNLGRVTSLPALRGTPSVGGPRGDFLAREKRWSP